MRTTPDETTFLAAVDEARKLGLPFAAHPVAKPDVLFNSGIASVEHSLQFPPDPNQSPAEIRDLALRMSRSGLRLSTTLVNLEGSLLIPYEEAKRRMRFRPRYISDYLFRDWAEQVEEKKELPLEEVAKLVPPMIREIAGLRAGPPAPPPTPRDGRVRFLAGTDLAVTFIEPGISLHDEPPHARSEDPILSMDALRAATSEPAAFFGMESALGGMVPGQVADLVLLDADPMKDIANTRRIVGVMQGGRWFDRKALDLLLR
jgi:imidazolonepropionase-like amidohydrolase